MIIIFNVFLALPWQRTNPIGAARFLRIKTRTPRDLDILEKMLVSLRRNRSRETEALIVFDRIVTVPSYIAVRRIGRNNQEEWLICLDGLVEESVSF
jgi:hypothetical protein